MSEIIKDNGMFQLIELFATCTLLGKKYKRSLGFVVKTPEAPMKDNWKYKNFDHANSRFEFLSSPIR